MSLDMSALLKSKRVFMSIAMTSPLRTDPSSRVPRLPTLARIGFRTNKLIHSKVKDLEMFIFRLRIYKVYERFLKSLRGYFKFI
jgi:hypothetical protein